MDHRNNSPDKSQWTIDLIVERSCFKLSLISSWNEPQYTSWGLHFENDTVTYLGHSSQNEPNACKLFIAKFVDSNKNNKWHGYPANPSGQKPQDIPPESVLNQWLNKEYLRPQTIRKISRGQKCKL
ncbi:MAG TPA: hypothetical protein VK184_03275 [Nostocaceae cyanobacterium]|nr:hypothetical protein [Nostocaceae cyanobacterium]